MTVGLVGGGNISGSLGFDRGFDQYTSEAINWENVQSNPAELDEIRKWIRSSKKEEQPLFMFLHNHLCHAPYLRAPEEFGLRYLEKEVANLPISKSDLVTGQGFDAMASSFWANVDFNNPDHVAHIVGLYDGGISYMDYVFGETIKVLKEEGIFDDSIIVLLSDHGEEFYEHQTYSHGHLFEETIHVPLIMKFPQGEYGGTNIPNLVRTMDLMPSLFEFLGIRVTHFVQGVSFMPLLAGRGKYDPVILSYDGHLQTVRFHEDGFFYSNQPSRGGSEWLFDAKNDPEETQNLVDKKPEIIADMRAKAKLLIESDRARLKKYDYDGGKTQKAELETLNQLKNLGYIQ